MYASGVSLARRQSMIVRWPVNLNLGRRYAVGKPRRRGRPVSTDLIAILTVGIALAGLQLRIAGVLRASVASLKTDTKAGLETLRVEMTDGMGVLRTEFRSETAALRTELKDDIGTLRTELKNDIATLRTEVREDIGALRSEVREDIGALRTEVREDLSAFRTEVREDLGALRGDVRDGFRQVDTRVRFLEERAFLGRRSRSGSGDS